MPTDDKRAEIVREARTWIKTPYKGWSRLKGCGTDCGQLLVGIYQNVGLLPSGDLGIEPAYSLQVAQHKADTAYIDKVKEYMREIPESEVLPGDVVIYRLGLAFAHAGIVVTWPDCIIHALAHRGVSTAHGVRTPVFRRCQKKFFTLKEVE